MDQFYLDSISLITFMIIWLAFAIGIYLIHSIYRIYKTKKISDSFGYVSKMHARMFCKFYITTMLFFIFCAVLKSIVE